MKNKLLTSILAVMLLLSVSVSALDAGVSPTPIEMTEDTPATVDLIVTVDSGAGEVLEDVTCDGGTGLTVELGTGATVGDTTTYPVDLTLDQDYAKDTEFTCTVTLEEETPVDYDFDVSVTADNNDPKIETIYNQDAIEEETFTYQVEASDDDETEDLTYELTEKPTGMTISNAGLISWTPDDQHLEDAPYTVEVTVTDERDGTDTESFEIDITAVNDAPTLSVPDQEAVGDVDFELDVSEYADDVDSVVADLTYELTGGPSEIDLTEEGLLTWTPDDDDDLGRHTISVTVSDGDKSTTSDFVIAVRPNVVCEYNTDGSLGDLRFDDIDDSDFDEEYKAGDDINIEVEVENTGDDDLDVAVEAWLFNLDEGRRVAFADMEKNIDEDDTESFDFDLEVETSDWDEGDDFMLYILAQEDEEDHCTYEAYNIDLVRENDDVRVTELTLLPEQASPGDKVTARVTVENVGDDKQDNVYVRLKAWGVSEETANFDLDDYSDSDNDYTVEIQFEIPEDTDAGEYFVSAEVYFDGGAESHSMTDSVMVKGEASVDTDAELPTLTMVAEESATVQAGKQVAVPVVIRNDGNGKATFTLEVSNLDGWATVMGIEQPEQLGAGESGHAYIYLETREDAAIGVHEFSLNARNDIGLLATKKVSVGLEGQAQESAEESDGVTGWFTRDVPAAGAFYAAGTVVLVLVGLFFLRMLFKK